MWAQNTTLSVYSKLVFPKKEVWNNIWNGITLVTLLIFVLQVIFFFFLSLMKFVAIKDTSVIVWKNHSAETLCMTLFSLLFFQVYRCLFCQDKGNIACPCYFQHIQSSCLLPVILQHCRDRLILWMCLNLPFRQEVILKITSSKGE